MPPGHKEKKIHKKKFEEIDSIICELKAVEIMNPVWDAQVISHLKVSNNRTKQDWTLMVRHVCDKLYPNAETITLVMDNLASHCATALFETFEPAEAKGSGIDWSLFLHPSTVAG